MTDCSISTGTKAPSGNEEGMLGICCLAPLPYHSQHLGCAPPLAPYSPCYRAPSSPAALTERTNPLLTLLGLPKLNATNEYVKCPAPGEVEACER